MAFSHWLRTLRAYSLFNKRSARKKSTAYKLCLERLEDRTVPSVTVVNAAGHGYTGLDFNQSGGYVPPDTCGAAGPVNYVETVNQEIAIYSSKATGAIQVKDSLSHFLFTTGALSRAGTGSGLSDPIVAYDELAGRFIVGDQDVNFSTHVSAFDLAVSKTNNPTTLSSADWNFYKITTTQSGFDADYPGNFGYNRDGFVFTLNMFGVFGGGHVKVVSVDSNDLTNGVSQANLHVYQNDLADFSVRPTTMHGSVSGDPMWLVTEHGDNHSIDVYKMSSPNGTILSNSATFGTSNQPTTLQVTPYSAVVIPRNPNGTGITNNIDARIMKAAEANNILVATHTVGVSSTQDDAQWYAIDVSSGTPVLQQQGRIDTGTNTYVYYTGIDINSTGQIGMSYMRSHTTSTPTSSDYMSMWVTGRTSSDTLGTMQTPVIVPAGTGQTNYHDFTSGGRAGDLSGINVDPVDGSFWAANEFANTEATANWGTAIANFTLTTPVSADLAVTNSGPSSVNVTVGPTTATYTITLVNNGPNSAPNVVLSNILPAGSTFVSMTPALGNPDTFIFSQSGGTITETAATVATGNTDTFTLVVSAPPNLANGADFSDTASVSSAAGDPNTANNSATVTGTIVNNSPGADLAITSSGPAISTEGSNVTYTFIVTNNGPTDALSVILTNTLGANLKFVSATTTQGTFSQAGGVVTFSFGTMVLSSTATVTVTAQSTEEGDLSDTSSVASSTNDPNTTDNSAVVTTTVSEPAIIVSAPITTSNRSLSNVTVATFTHANGVEPTSDFSAIINWGDGNTSIGTITKSGSTYTVKGSHTYPRHSGSHKITTTVTEIGNAAQLLLGKVGDEVPDLPDHVGKKQDHGDFDLFSIDLNQFDRHDLAALLAQFHIQRRLTPSEVDFFFSADDS
jgi:uncharacterized repeat protein (TIGR01451 family)